MRISIDKLMIGIVMILAVCLYAPTVLEDSRANNTTNEEVAVSAEENKAEAAKETEDKETEAHEIKPSLMAQEEMEKALSAGEDYDEFLEQVETYYAEKEAVSTEQLSVTYENTTGSGVLTASKGVNYGPSGKETYYNLDMSGVIATMQSLGYYADYWVREDGVKMYGDYVMVAANLSVHPRGSLVECSLGTAMVVDTGGFAASNPYQLDIATTW